MTTTPPLLHQNHFPRRKSLHLDPLSCPLPGTVDPSPPRSPLRSPSSQVASQSSSPKTLNPVKIPPSLQLKEDDSTEQIRTRSSSWGTRQRSHSLHPGTAAPNPNHRRYYPANEHSALFTPPARTTNTVFFPETSVTPPPFAALNGGRSSRLRSRRVSIDENFETTAQFIESIRTSLVRQT